MHRLAHFNKSTLVNQEDKNPSQEMSPQDSHSVQAGQTLSWVQVIVSFDGPELDSVFYRSQAVTYLLIQKFQPRIFMQGTPKITLSVKYLEKELFIFKLFFH